MFHAATQSHSAALCYQLVSSYYSYGRRAGQDATTPFRHECGALTRHGKPLVRTVLNEGHVRVERVAAPVAEVLAGLEVVTGAPFEVKVLRGQ